MVSLAIYQTVNPDLPQTFQQGNKTKALYSMLPVFESLREPEDFEDDDRCWMHPTQISTQRREDFRLLVDEFMEESQGKRKEPNLSTYRRHIEQLLLNLINALCMHRWLLIALDEKAYREDEVYIKAGWQFKTMIDTWTELLGCEVKPRVKVDKAAYTVKAAQSCVADYFRIYAFTSSSFFAASKVMTSRFCEPSLI